MSIKVKSLRELQQKGEKAILGKDVILLTSRKGPVGVLIPVTRETLPVIQSETERMMAIQSLKKTWALARDLKLDQMEQDEIDLE
jgi:hypothetical protein